MNRRWWLISSNYRIVGLTFFILGLGGCFYSKEKVSNIELIANAKAQDSIFANLISLTGEVVSESKRSDSLIFLILPLQASCPSCRRKTIDSLIYHQNIIPANHYIILSASGGVKTIRSYFLDQNYELPIIKNKLLLDSSNKAFKYGLYKDNPAFYYTAGRKAYKKVSALPSTIKRDLQEYFSNTRGRD